MMPDDPNNSAATGAGMTIGTFRCDAQAGIRSSMGGERLRGRAPSAPVGILRVDKGSGGQSAVGGSRAVG
jgi:hypothetical protein